MWASRGWSCHFPEISSLYFVLLLPMPCYPQWAWFLYHWPNNIHSTGLIPCFQMFQTWNQLTRAPTAFVSFSACPQEPWTDLINGNKKCLLQWTWILLNTYLSICWWIWIKKNLFMICAVIAWLFQSEINSKSKILVKLTQIKWSKISFLILIFAIFDNFTIHNVTIFFQVMKLFNPTVLWQGIFGNKIKRKDRRRNQKSRKKRVNYSQVTIL